MHKYYDNDDSEFDDMPLLTDALALNNNTKKNITELKKEFNGTLNINFDWLQCLSCNKYHPQEMYLLQHDSCGHCYLWLHENLIDIENNKYSGDVENWIDIKKYLNLET